MEHVANAWHETTSSLSTCTRLHVHMPHLALIYSIRRPQVWELAGPVAKTASHSRQSLIALTTRPPVSPLDHHAPDQTIQLRRHLVV